MSSATLLDLEHDRAVRWVRVRDEWVLAGPADKMIAGDTVEVHQAHGGIEEVEVGDWLGVLSDGRTACRKAEGHEPARWVRHSGVWVVSGEGLEPGQIVDVRSASRGMSRVRIGQIVDRRDGKVLALPDQPVERPSTVRPQAGKTYRRKVDGKIVKAYSGPRGVVYGKVFNDRSKRYERAGLAFYGGVEEVQQAPRRRQAS